MEHHVKQADLHTHTRACIAGARERRPDSLDTVAFQQGVGERDIHVLGYFIPYDDEAFQEKLRGLRETRQRNKLMIARLRELGIPITLESVYRRKKGEDKNIGRPPSPKSWWNWRGRLLDEAFAKYLGREGAAYVNPRASHPRRQSR
ncbi:hypothetical protein [Brevibacillus sedimenti]|uniref:hypothetical protein n=1 Tax=Brevibacillus sedimenti TaxID=2613334 RepID=UPI001E2EA8B9|nr:hypothetical protein [Anoxybacillus sediminis]